MAGALVPVASQQGSLYVNLDATFRSLATVAVPFLQNWISEQPPTYQTVIDDSPREQVFEPVGGRGHREHALHRRASVGRELAPKLWRIAKRGEKHGQCLDVSLGENQPTSGEPDQPGDLPGVRADDRDAAPQRLDDRTPELLLPGLRRV